MAKSKKQGLSEEGWLELVECFRRKESITEAARSVGVDRKTAKKALELGYEPGRAFKAGKAPISQVLDADRALARAETEATLFADKAAEEGTIADRLLVAVNNAAESVVRSHGDSGIRIHLAGTSTQAALASAARLQVAGDMLAVRMVEKIEMLVDEDVTPLEKLDLKSSMRLLREIAKFTRDASESMRIVDDLERRHLGTPEDIRALILDINRTENIPEEEADHIMQVAMQSLGVDTPSEDVDMELVDDPELLDAEYEALQAGMIEEDERDEDDPEEEYEEGEEEEKEEGAMVEGGDEAEPDLHRDSH